MPGRFDSPMDGREGPVARVVCLCLLTVAMTCAGCGSRQDRLLDQDGSLWLLDSSGKPVSCYAEKGCYEKSMGDKSSYYVFFNLKAADHPLCVIECTEDNAITRVQEYRSDDWRLANAVMKVTWLGGSRIFVDTHVNPSLGIGIEIDLDARKTDVFYGVEFTWSREHRRLAYLWPPPHFGTPPEISSRLMIGHKEICKVPRRVHSELYWHPTEEKLLALIPAEDGEAGQLVVVDSASSASPSVKRFELRPQEH